MQGLKAGILMIQYKMACLSRGEERGLGKVQNASKRSGVPITSHKTCDQVLLGFVALSNFNFNQPLSIRTGQSVRRYSVRTDIRIDVQVASYRPGQQ